MTYEWPAVGDSCVCSPPLKRYLLLGKGPLHCLWVGLKKQAGPMLSTVALFPSHASKLAHCVSYIFNIGSFIYLPFISEPPYCIDLNIFTDNKSHISQFVPMPHHQQLILLRVKILRKTHLLLPRLTLLNLIFFKLDCEQKSPFPLSCHVISSPHVLSRS